MNQEHNEVDNYRYIITLEFPWHEFVLELVKIQPDFPLKLYYPLKYQVLGIYHPIDLVLRPDHLHL